MESTDHFACAAERQWVSIRALGFNDPCRNEQSIIKPTVFVNDAVAHNHLRRSTTTLVVNLQEILRRRIDGRPARSRDGIFDEVRKSGLKIA